MKLTVFDLINYIFKHKWFIIIFIVIATAVGVLMIDSQQTYTAQAVIRFTKLDTESGYLSDGSMIDVNEIISPRVISEAIQTIGTDDNVEDIRSKCTIEGIVPDDIQSLKEANQKDGTEYTYYPKDYTISYTASSERSAEYARDVLDAILTAYTNYFSDTYISIYSLPEIEFETIEEEHDYIEIADIINTAVVDAASYFSDMIIGNSEFRSPRTGYSFRNMSTMYGQIRDVTLPAISSTILNAHLTKDREVLIKTYQYKKQVASLNYESKERSSQTALSLMDSFVEVNKEVPGSYGEGDDDDDKYHAYDVYRVTESEDGESTYTNPGETTYDELINNYVVDGVAAGEYLIDNEYYDKIIGIYSSEVSEDINTEELIEEVEDELKEVADEVSDLYKITNTFLSDFQRYKLTQNINLLTSITTKGNNPNKLYAAIVFVMAVMIACVAAIAYEIVTLNKKSEQKTKEALTAEQVLL